MRAELDLLTELLRRDDRVGLAARLNEAPPRALARLLRQLGRDDLRHVFALVTPARADELFTVLDGEVRAELLTQLSRERAGQLFALLDPDDRAWLSQRLPEDAWRPLLEGLPASARRATVGLMSYPVGSTGRVMSPHVIGLDVDESAGAAMEQVRQASRRTETVYMLPVLDAADVVVGVVSLRRPRRQWPRDPGRRPDEDPGGRGAGGAGPGGRGAHPPRGTADRCAGRRRRTPPARGPHRRRRDADPR